jgi:hypothetical protein
LIFYVPPSLEVTEGDITEIELGRPARKRRGDPGAINRAVRIRESMGDTNMACRWDPEDERMWMRILFCDWMESEGWQFARGLNKTWFKPARGAD